MSVIIPVCNGARFLRAAIESALAQTIAPLEVIVLDDGSTDDSAEIARSMPVTYLHQENQGLAAARNAAIAGARGDFFALLDSDDLWEPEKLARQLSALEANEANAYASCHLRYLISSKLPAPAWFHRNGPEEGEPGYFAPSCWTIPRPVWEKVGEFRPELRYAEDMDWLVRAKDAGIRTLVVPQTLVFKRVHENNMMADGPPPARFWLDNLRQSLRRKRGEGQVTQP